MWTFGKWIRNHWITIWTWILLISTPAGKLGWGGRGKESLGLKTASDSQAQFRWCLRGGRPLAAYGSGTGVSLGLHCYFPGWKESPIASHVIASDTTPMGEEKGLLCWQWATQASPCSLLVCSWECRFLLAPTGKRCFFLWHHPVRKAGELQAIRSSLPRPIIQCCQNRVRYSPTVC